MSTTATLYRRLASLLVRGVVRLTRDVDDAPQEVQAELAQGLRETQRSQPFGLCSTPVNGAEALVVHASPDQPITILVSDARYEVRGLASGEVAVHDAHGHSVRLTEAGIVIVTGGDGVAVQASPAGPSLATFSGVVHGTATDTLTGLTFFALGSTTEQLKTEKT